MPEYPLVQLTCHEASFCLVNARQIRGIWLNGVWGAIERHLPQDRIDYYLDQTLFFDGLIAKLEPIAELDYDD